MEILNNEAAGLAVTWLQGGSARWSFRRSFRRLRISHTQSQGKARTCSGSLVALTVSGDVVVAGPTQQNPKPV